MPFLGYECWVGEHPCLKAEFPDKYDILFLKADEERKKYNILFLNYLFDKSYLKSIVHFFIYFVNACFLFRCIDVWYIF